MLSRKRKVEADRNRAAEMREQAKTDEIGAREREAKAARAEADAQAGRSRGRAAAGGSPRHGSRRPRSVRAGAQEQLRKADELDPDVVTTERDAQSRDQVPREAAGTEELRRDRGARTPATPSSAATPAGTTSVGRRSQVPGAGHRPGAPHHEPAAQPTNPAATVPGTSSHSTPRISGARRPIAAAAARSGTGRVAV